MNQSEEICRSVCPDIKDLSSANKIALASITVILVPLTVVANAIVFYGLSKTKSAGSRLFVMTLCINDILIGAVLQPITFVYAFFDTYQTSCALKYIIQFLSYGLLALDGFIVSTMGIERLIVLKYPMKNILFQWQAVRKYVLICDVMFAIMMAIVSVLVTKYSKHFFVFSLCCLVTLLIIVLVTTTAYFIVCRHVRRSVEKLYNSEDSSIQSRSEKTRHDVALARSVSVILVLAFFLYFPYFVTALLWTLAMMTPEPPSKAVNEALVWSFIPIFINSSLNVFIYSYHNRPLKRYLSDMCPCIFRLNCRLPIDDINTQNAPKIGSGIAIKERTQKAWSNSQAPIINEKQCM